MSGQGAKNRRRRVSELFISFSRDRSLGSDYRRSLLFLTLISIVLIGVDYLVGPVIQVSVVYLLVVTLVTWFIGPKLAYGLCILLPAIRMVVEILQKSSSSLAGLSASVTIHIGVLVLSVSLVTWVKRLVAEVKTRKGDLSICTYCTRIYNEYGVWEEIESYVARQSQMKFSHSVCPECREKRPDRVSQTYESGLR